MKWTKIWYKKFQSLDVGALVSWRAFGLTEISHTFCYVNLQILMNESVFHFCGRWILTTTVFHFPKSTSAGGIPDFLRVCANFVSSALFLHEGKIHAIRYSGIEPRTFSQQDFVNHWTIWAAEEIKLVTNLFLLNISFTLSLVDDIDFDNIAAYHFLWFQVFWPTQLWPTAILTDGYFDRRQFWPTTILTDGRFDRRQFWPPAFLTDGHFDRRNYWPTAILTDCTFWPTATFNMIQYDGKYFIYKQATESNTDFFCIHLIHFPFIVKIITEIIRICLYNHFIF
jgi:hypothetical protein